MSFWKGVVTGLSIAVLLASMLRVAIARANLKDKPTRAGGCPLDAITYDSPKFADGDDAYKVTDRLTGQEWWLVRMQDGNWIALLICESEASVG